MGTLYLVRHGQASFGADDYDKLSDLGHRQSVRLGEYFAQKGVHFDAVLAGTLRRHLETLAGIRKGMQHEGEHLPWEGLNEYDSEAVIATVHPEKLRKPTSPELYRAHADKGADLLLVPSAFTFTTGQAHWEVLLRARAIENLAYVVAAAQGGLHVNGRRTWGQSLVASPWGEVLAQQPQGEGVVLAEVDPVRLQSVRQQLPALNHRTL